MTTDFVTDKNPTAILYALAADIAPDYVKQSSEFKKEDLDKLHKDAFADPKNRLFPLHSKEATWLSAAYLVGNMGGDEEMEKVITSAKHFGIEEDVAKVVELFSQNIKSAASKEEPPMVKYAVAVDMQGVQGRGVEYYYGMNNHAQIVDSASNVLEDYSEGKVPLFTLREASKALVKEATETNLPLNTLSARVVELGTIRVPDASVAVTLSSFRKSASNKMAYESYDTQIVRALSMHDSPADVIDSLEKIAKDVCVMDMKSGVTYDSISLDPYQIIFSGISKNDMEKMAAHVLNIDGCQVPIDEFMNLSEEKVSNYLGVPYGTTIKEAKEALYGERTLEKSARVSDSINKLGSETCQEILNILCNTGW